MNENDKNIYQKLWKKKYLHEQTEKQSKSLNIFFYRTVSVLLVVHLLARKKKC